MKGENMPLTGCKGNGLVKRYTKGHINNSRVLEAHLTWEAWETWMPAETERFAVCYREVALLFQLRVWNTWICWFHYKLWRQDAGDTRHSFQFAGALCSVHCSLHTNLCQVHYTWQNMSIQNPCKVINGEHTLTQDFFSATHCNLWSTSADIPTYYLLA